MQQDLILKRINTIYFLAIIFLGIYFGKERAIFCDSSMQLFDMARTMTPSVNINMATTVVNFVLPYLAIIIGLPLKIVVYLLVLNYLLIPILVFFFLRYKQQSVKYEMSFLIAFSIFNWQTFYYPIHDYWTGFYLLFVLYRVVDDASLSIKLKLKNRLVFVLIILIIFTHLSMLISLGFLLLYLLFEKAISLKTIVKYYSFMMIVLVIKILFINSGYQNSVIDINSFSWQNISQVLTSKTIKEFLPTLFTTNLNFTLLAIFSGILFFFRKNKLSLLLLNIVFISSVFIIHFLFGSFGYSVYSEGYFKSTNIVIGIIFANVLIEVLTKKILINLILSINFIFSVCVLFQGGLVFEKQYKFINESCKKFNRNVYLTSNKEICPLECLAVSRQSLIINQLENDNNAVIFSNIRNEHFVENLNVRWIEENKTKPVRYFNFSDDITYLDADSMQFPIDSLSILFRDNKCDDLLKRLDQ